MADFPTDEELARFDAAMNRVKDVLAGGKKPGGPSCRFPHCSCNSPWTLCELKGVRPHDPT